MKKIEESRYDKRALKIIEKLKETHNGDLNEVENISSLIKTQYLFYKKLIKDKVKKGMKVLEIGCGTGEFSWQAISSGAYVTLLDISENSLEAARYRFKKNMKNIQFKKGDMENLPFKNESFDIVLCSGSLRYGDHEIVRNEIFRVLKNNSFFICIDSLDHNLIYKINRFIHFLRGKRTLETINRIPNLKLIKSYGEYGWEKHYYFGSFIWLIKLLDRFLSPKIIIKFSIFLDKLFANHLTAFNFVMLAKKK